jgi:hypothetical protein
MDQYLGRYAPGVKAAAPQVSALHQGHLQAPACSTDGHMSACSGTYYYQVELIHSTTPERQLRVSIRPISNK